MLIELICALILYLLKLCFYGNTDLVDPDSSYSNDATVLLSVADRLQKLYGGKCHVGLHIPDANSASRQNVDMVLVTDGEATVVSVVNVSGILSVDEKDSSWVYTDTEKHKSAKQRLPDPIAAVKEKVSILEAYLEQRGLLLPEGYLSYKVICPNPHFSATSATSFPFEIITYDQWTQLKPELKNTFSGWIKGAFRSRKMEMQQTFHEQLNLILRTAPVLDRILLKDNKVLLGEFLEFMGKEDDIQALRKVRRSKVSNLIIQKTTTFGVGKGEKRCIDSRLQSS